MALQIRAPATGATTIWGDRPGTEGGLKASVCPSRSPDKIGEAIQGFYRELTDPLFFAPMVFAQGVFGFSRLSIVKMLSPGIAQGAALAGANLGAFALEGLAFVGSARGLRQAFGRGGEPAAGFGKELGHAYLTLGLLKVLGGGTEMALRRHFQGISSATLLRSAPLAAQFSGIYLSHTLAPGLGLGEYLNPADRALHSAMTVLQFAMAGHILARIPKYKQLNHEVRSATERWVQRNRHQGTFKDFETFAGRVAFPQVDGGILPKGMGTDLADLKKAGLFQMAEDPKKRPTPPTRPIRKPTPISGLRPPHPAMVMPVPGLAFRFASDGTVLDVQGKEPRNFFLNKPYFLGLKLHELPLPEAALEKLEAGLRRTLELGEIQSVEFVLPTPENLLYREVLMSPLGDGEVLATVRDITPSKTKEAQREVLLSILNASSDLVIIATPEGEIIYANKAVFEKVGRMEPELLEKRKDVFENFSPRSAHLIQEVGIPTAERDGLWVGETNLLDVKGDEIPVLLRIIAHRDAKGSLTHFSAVLTDMSHFKKVEEFRISEERLAALQLLVPGLVHDINNLMAVLGLRLNVSKGDLDKLAGGMDDFESGNLSGPAKENIKQKIGSLAGELGEMAKSVKTIQYLLNSLRELDTRPKQGPSFSVMELLDPDVLREVLPPGHPLQVFSTSDRGMLPGPKEEILRAVHNVVKNAGEAVEGREDQLIKIESEKVWLSEVQLSELFPVWQERGLRAGSFIKIGIEDHGKGMDELTQARVFDLHYTTKKAGGDLESPTGNIRGLGMAITRKIIQDAGGFILFKSQPEKGTRFDVFLPEVRPPEPRVFHLARYPKIIGIPLIFLNADPGIRRLVPEELGVQGFRNVGSAKDLDELRNRLDSNAEDAVVLADVSLQDLAGEAWQSIKRDYPQTRVIPLSIRQEEAGALQVFFGKSPVYLSPEIMGDRLAFVVASLVEKEIATKK